MMVINWKNGEGSILKNMACVARASRGQTYKYPSNRSNFVHREHSILNEKQKKVEQ